MSHRTVLYVVRVHPKYQRGEDNLLGEMTGSGGVLLVDVLRSAMTGFAETTEDGLKAVHADYTTDPAEDELFVSLRHGESGVSAEIVREAELRYRQELADTHTVKCGCLFRVPRNQRMGWAAIHVNNNRRIVGLLRAGIHRYFERHYPELSFILAPFVLTSVLDEAIEQGRVDELRLIKYEPPGDRGFDSTQRWIPTDKPGRLELVIKTGRDAGFIRAEALRSFRRGNTTALDQITTFETMHFDEAVAQVQLPNGQTRSFNIEKPDSGFPFSTDLDPQLELDDEENPTEDTLIAALRAALDEQVGNGA